MNDGGRIIPGARSPKGTTKNGVVADAPAGALRVRIGPSSIGYVNVRKAPDVNSPVISLVKPGQIHTVSDVRAGWYRLDGKPGRWVAGRYVQVIGRQDGQ